MKVDLHGSGVSDSVAAAAKFNSQVLSLHMNSNSQLHQSSLTPRMVPNNTGGSKHMTVCDDDERTGDGSSQLNLSQDVTQMFCVEGGGCSGDVSRLDFGLDKNCEEGDFDSHTTSIVRSSNQINRSVDTIDAETAVAVTDDDDDDDVSWYFNADDDNELEQYKNMIVECTEKLGSIGALSIVGTGQSSLEPKSAADCFSSNSELIFSENDKKLDEFHTLFHKGEERTSTSVVGDCNIDDGAISDAELDSCFDDLSNQDETLKSSLDKFDDECVGNMKDFTMEKDFETEPGAVADADDDIDFKDCFTNDSADDEMKPIISDGDKTNLKENKACGLSKIGNTCLESEILPKHTEITVSHDKMASPEPVGKMLEILGHSIGGREQSASRKLLNNSRHFRTVESVVKEHSSENEILDSKTYAKHSNTETDISESCGNIQIAGDVNSMLELLGHHPRDQPEQPISPRLLNNSRHFRTIESIVKEHRSGSKIPESKASLSASQSGEIEPSVTSEYLNDSRCFYAVENGIKKHGSEDEMTSSRHLGLVVGNDVVEDQTGEHGSKGGGQGETASKDGASLDTQLQSILQEKASLHKSSLHSRVVGQSRHFKTMDDEQCKKTNDDVEPTTMGTIKYKKIPTREQEKIITDIWDLGFGLSHGADHEMKLAVHTYMSQLQRKEESDSTDGRPSFMADRVFVCCITGPSKSHSSVVDGIVLPVKEYQIQNVALQCGNRLNCLLINGDLKPSAKHAGYKESIKASRVYCNTEVMDHQDISVWMQQAMGTLDKLEINIVMIKGQSDEQLLNTCTAQGIIMLQNVPHRALLGIAGDRDIVTYITDANQGNIVPDVNVKVWEQGWQAKPIVRKQALERTYYVMITSKQQLQTAVLCSPTITSLIGAESRFFKCLHRLSKAVADRQVLPGAGAIEGAVIRCLDDVAEGKIKLDFDGENQRSSSWTTSVIQEYASSVAIAMRGGFMQYLVQTLQNLTDFGGNMTELAALLEDRIKSDDGDGFVALLTTELGQAETNSCERCDMASSTPSEVHTSSTGNQSDQHSAFGRNIHRHRNIDSKIDSTGLSRLSSNASKTNQRQVYDSYRGKLSAWECAWEIVRTVLQTDCVLISGIDKEQSVL